MNDWAWGSRGARTLVVDSHVHTDVSYDCEMPVEAVLARAVAVGLGAVAITDHDSAGALPRVSDIAHEYGIRVAPDVEVSTVDGHLLAPRVDDPSAMGQPLLETTREVREADGLVAVPHLLQTLQHGAPRRATRGVDTTEAYNVRMFTGFRNRQAWRYTRRQGLPGTGGSDAHQPALVGQAYTAALIGADGSVTTDAILEEIRAERVVVRGAQTNARQYLWKYALNVRLKTASFL